MESRDLSRRTLLAVLGVSAGVVAAGVSPAPAFAAVIWGYPLAVRTEPSSGFGMRDGGMHYGLDYPRAQGTAIFACAAGVVTRSQDSYAGYGQTVEVTHADGYMTRYAHMVPGSRIANGTTVSRGTPIGGVGNTGRSFGAHLHVEIRVNGTAIDPFSYIQNAPLPSEEDDLTPEQAAALNQLVSDVTWLKSRVGGSSAAPSLRDEFTAVKAQVAAAQGDVTWLKDRIGGSASSESITDIVRAIRNASS